jgi:hypothetical protein
MEQTCVYGFNGSIACKVDNAKKIFSYDERMVSGESINEVKINFNCIGIAFTEEGKPVLVSHEELYVFNTESCKFSEIKIPESKIINSFVSIDPALNKIFYAITFKGNNVHPYVIKGDDLYVGDPIMEDVTYFALSKNNALAIRDSELIISKREMGLVEKIKVPLKTLDIKEKETNFYIDDYFFYFFDKERHTVRVFFFMNKREVFEYHGIIKCFQSESVIIVDKDDRLRISGSIVNGIGGSFREHALVHGNDVYVWCKPYNITFDIEDLNESLNFDVLDINDDDQICVSDYVDRIERFSLIKSDLEFPASEELCLFILYNYQFDKERFQKIKPFLEEMLKVSKAPSAQLALDLINDKSIE